MHYEGLLQGERKNLINCQVSQRRQLGSFYSTCTNESFKFVPCVIPYILGRAKGNITTPEGWELWHKNFALETRFLIPAFYYRAFENFCCGLAASGLETGGKSLQNIKLNKKGNCCSILM